MHLQWSIYIFLAQEAFMLMHSFSTTENMLYCENKGKLVDLCDYSNASHFNFWCFRTVELSLTFQNLLNVNHKAIIKPQRTTWIPDIGHYRPDNYHFGSIFVELKSNLVLNFVLSSQENEKYPYKNA